MGHWWDRNDEARRWATYLSDGRHWWRGYLASAGSALIGMCVFCKRAQLRGSVRSSSSALRIAPLPRGTWAALALRGSHLDLWHLSRLTVSPQPMTRDVKDLWKLISKAINFRQVLTRLDGIVSSSPFKGNNKFSQIKWNPPSGIEYKMGQTSWNQRKSSEFLDGFSPRCPAAGFDCPHLSR